MNEDNLLGAVFLKPSIFAYLSTREEHFQKLNARRVWLAIKGCIADNIEPTLLDVQQRAPDVPPAYIAALTSNVPSSSNWKLYEKNVIDDWKRNQLRALAEEMITQAKNPSVTLGEITHGVESSLAAILSEGAHDEIHHMRDVMMTSVKLVEDRYNMKGDIPGIDTGFRRLNAYTMGFEPGKLYIIGGRPSSGKSAIVLSMANYQATKGLARPGYISLESSENETGIRAIAQRGKVNSNRILTGLLKEQDFRGIMNAASEIAESDWMIYDRANATLDQVISAARRMVLFHNCNILYVDYLQLITGKKHTETKFDHVSNVSMALKQLARDLQVPVVSTVQLNRDNHGNRPTMANIRESGQIEQDADVIMLLHRPNRELEMKMGNTVWNVVLIVEKCRDGKTGDVQLIFKADYVLFAEEEKHAE